MDSVALSKNEDGIEDTNMDHLHISLPEPTAFPRIGEQHQARIPSLLTEKERLQERQWPLEQGENTENAQIDPVLSTVLPCSGTSSWGSLERESFLLGLYIFGKDLLQVKNFMNERSFSNVLSYYYGSFYESVLYEKWTKGKKIQRKRCGRGKDLFTDKSLLKFLGRILPSVSKEAKRIVLEAAKRLKENKISMECFVFTVRSHVGLEVFVNAIGIGKGPYDLTNYALIEQARKKKAKTTPREIPSSKPFSSLTPGEIINYLTGGFRLSKTKSRDLFWKAVWPCLVAKGWHSKKLKGNLSKGHVVFLLPGIKKFSKRKHQKGTHYFDSISDVLDKVAAEPGLLEQKAECSIDKVAAEPSSRKPRAKGGKRSEGESPPVTGKKPGRPKCSRKKQRLNAEPKKFTIVDTSLVQAEEGPLQLTQLRTLPSMAKCNTNGLTQATQAMNENNLCGQSGKVKSMVPDNIRSHVSKRRRLVPCRHARTHPTTEEPASKQFTDTVTAEKDASTAIIDLDTPIVDLNVQPITDDLSVPTIDLNITPLIDLTIAPVLDLNMPPLIDLTISPVMDLNTTPAPEVSDAAAETLGAEACKGLFDLNSSPEECKGLFDLNSSPDEEESQPEEQEQLLQISQVVDKANIVEIPSPMPKSNIRRQSTRTRPPTLKAIETAAYGYLSPERSERAMKGPKLDNASFKPSRRATKKKRSQPLVPDADADADADAEAEADQM